MTPHSEIRYFNNLAADFPHLSRAVMTSDSDPIEVWLVSGSHQRAPQPGNAVPGPSPRLSGGHAAVKAELDSGMSLDIWDDCD